jgi:hypothetical protein
LPAEDSLLDPLVQPVAAMIINPLITTATPARITFSRPASY